MRALLRVASWRATEEALGDIIEEVNGGRRQPLWLAREVLITMRPRQRTTTRHERRSQMLSNVRRDVQYAVRTLARNPAFTLAALAPIALGIGINTGLFSILNSLALRPLPVPGSRELVTVHQQFQGVRQRRVQGARSLFSLPEYAVYRDNSRTLAGVMAYSRPRSMTLGGATPREVEAVIVTCNYFDVLELPPAAGAGFSASNCGQPHASPSVVVTHRLWTSVIGPDLSVAGKSLVLNGREVAVAGIAAEGFSGVDFTEPRSRSRAR